MSMAQIKDEMNRGYQKVQGRIQPHDVGQARKLGLHIHVGEFGIYAASVDWLIDYFDAGGLWSYTD